MSNQPPAPSAANTGETQLVSPGNPPTTVVRGNQAEMREAAGIDAANVAATAHHPVWCQEEECSVWAGVGGTHASRRILLPHDGLRATAVFVEQSTDGLHDGPPHVVVAVMRGGVEGPVQRWSCQSGRAVLAAMGDLLDQLDSDRSG